MKLLVHPQELDRTIIDEIAQCGADKIGIHPVGGAIADKSLADMPVRLQTDAARNLIDYAKARAILAPTTANFTARPTFPQLKILRNQAVVNHNKRRKNKKQEKRTIAIKGARDLSLRLFRAGVCCSFFCKRMRFFGT